MERATERALRTKETVLITIEGKKEPEKETTRDMMKVGNLGGKKR